MRSGPSANVLVRTALAVLFGFMSLFHGTVMAFAKADSVAHHCMSIHHVMTAEGHAAGHHQPAGHEQQSIPAMPDAAPSCYGVGCFIVLESLPPASPAAGFLLVATLSPAVAAAMVATQLDPAVPPPRPQV
jgi:hypothetical protein